MEPTSRAGPRKIGRSNPIRHRFSNTEALTPRVAWKTLQSGEFAIGPADFSAITPKDFKLMKVRHISTGRFCLIATAGLCAYCLAADEIQTTGTSTGWKQHDFSRTKPPVLEPSGRLESSPAPKDAVILFDGKNLDAWVGGDGKSAKWKVADGAFEVTPGTGIIKTKAKFGDVQLHAEWASPNPPVGKGQDRGNSGIFLMGMYELQVLDSYQADTYADGQAGAIYGQYPPIYNASRPPGEWQTFDVAFRRPRFDEAGKLLEPARVTLIYNGVLVQNNEQILGPTNWMKWLPYKRTEARLPIQLQDHGHRVRFRNVWLRDLADRPAPTLSALERPKPLTLSSAAIDRFVGAYVQAPNAGGAKIMISRREGYLLVKFPYGEAPYVFQPFAPNVFEMPDTDARLTFQVDAQGRVTGAAFKIGDATRNLAKVD